MSDVHMFGAGIKYTQPTPWDITIDTSWLYSKLTEHSRTVNAQDWSPYLPEAIARRSCEMLRDLLIADIQEINKG